MQKVIRFIKKNIVLCVAALAAFVTCFFVPPSVEYLEYFDYRTLACLFITLAVVCALRQIRFFAILARRIVQTTGNLRMLSLALIYITFIGSMIIANDMALITFLPLGYFALSVTDNEKYSAYLFILQNISANLGGCLRLSAILRTCIFTATSVFPQESLQKSCFRLFCWRWQCSQCAVCFFRKSLCR